MRQRLRALLPEQHPTTKLIMGLCVGLFVVMALDTFQHFNPPDPLSALLFSPPIELLLRWGAHIRGELAWWRVIMSTVVHIGAIHLLFNMSALRDVGRAVENWYGSSVALFAFALTGVGAAAASNVLGGLDLPADAGGLVWLLAKVQGGKGVAAGASGGLMGLIGVMSVAGHRSGHALGLAIRNAMLRWAFLAMLLGVALGFDNIAHGFGFLIGAALAFVLPTPASLQRRSTRNDALKLALVALSLATLGLGIAGLIRSNLDQRAKDACLNAPSAGDDLPAALSTCADALAKLPTDPDLLDRAAALYLRQGDADTPARLFAAALPDLPSLRRAQLGQLTFNRCVAFLEATQSSQDADGDTTPPNQRARRRPDASKQPPSPQQVFFCEQAPLLLPTDPAPYNNLIIAYEWTQQPHRVPAVCEAAARHVPADAVSSNLRRACPSR